MCLLTIDPEVSSFGWSLFVSVFIFHCLISVRRSLKFSRMALRSQIGLRPRDDTSALESSIRKLRCTVVVCVVWGMCQSALLAHAFFPFSPLKSLWVRAALAHAADLAAHAVALCIALSCEDDNPTFLQDLQVKLKQTHSPFKTFCCLTKSSKLHPFCCSYF